LVIRLGRLLAVFVVIVMYFIFIENAYRLYLSESHHAGMNFLFGGINFVAFWGGMIIVGSIIPAVVLLNPKTAKSIPWIVFSSVLVVFGVLCERFLIVIPGQTHPPELFPNMEITSSVIDEGVVTYYVSIAELLQAVAVVAIIGFMFVVGLKLFKLLPTEAKVIE